MIFTGPYYTDSCHGADTWITEPVQNTTEKAEIRPNTIASASGSSMTALSSGRMSLVRVTWCYRFIIKRPNRDRWLSRWKRCDDPAAVTGKFKEISLSFRDIASPTLG